MPSSETTFETEKASRYLQQLCKHFGHKVEVEFTPEKGAVWFPCGEARFKADTRRLCVTASAETEAGLSKTKAILEDHILRFAFREKLDCLKWD
ncbi:MAG: DUF2218 domain-containing protein [Pseudomonadota bacterium]